MGKTVIEELVISLGLDAKALEDSKAMSAIDSIRDSVGGLNDELKGVEKTFKEMGSAGGRVKFGSTEKTQRVAKKNNFTPAEEWLKDFSGKVVSRKDAPEKEKSTETPKEKRERRGKPIKSFNDILNMMPGLASVVYMAKEIFSLASKIMSMFGQSNEMARDLKNAAARSGISTSMLQTIGLQSQEFGGKKEETMAEIEKLITGIPAFAGSTLPELITRLKVSPYNEQGKLRPSDDILKDVMQGLQTFTGGDLRKGAQFSNEVGMSAASINALAQGRDAYFKAEQEYLQSGMIINKETQDRLDAIARDTLNAKQKIETSKAEITKNNADIQYAWNAIMVSLTKTVAEISGKKLETAKNIAIGSMAGPMGMAVAGTYPWIKEMLKKGEDAVTMPHAPIQYGHGSGGQLPTSATIIINGDPKNGGQAEIKWNKPGPYRENLQRVQ